MQALTQRLAPALLAGALLATSIEARGQELFSIDDVRGDDDGNGSLIYPNRPDMQKGDLDLVRVAAEQRSDGVWFVIEMAQPVRSPVGRVTKIGQTPLEQLARNGFSRGFCQDPHRVVETVKKSRRQDPVIGKFEQSRP